MNHTKSMSAEMKAGILHRVWAGEKVARVARECGISRQAIYTWKRKADNAVSRALRERKRGPKPHRQAPGQAGAGAGDQSLTGGPTSPGLPHQSQGAAMDTQQTHRQDVKRPGQCPVCGCEKIYKNGTYTVRDHSLRDRAGYRRVQRYICVWCKSSICVH